MAHNNTVHIHILIDRSTNFSQFPTAYRMNCTLPYKGNYSVAYFDHITAFEAL